MQVTVSYLETPALTMYQTLVGSENRAALVTVHRGKITKITPVEEGNVCAGVKHPPTGAIDNSKMLARLLAEPFGEYYVVVCWGKIAEVRKVVKDAAIKVEDMAPSPTEVPSEKDADTVELEAAESDEAKVTPKPPPRRRRTTKAKAPTG